MIVAETLRRKHERFTSTDQDNRENQPRTSRPMTEARIVMVRFGQPFRTLTERTAARPPGAAAASCTFVDDGR